MTHRSHQGPAVICDATRHLFHSSTLSTLMSLYSISLSHSLSNSHHKIRLAVLRVHKTTVKRTTITVFKTREIWNCKNKTVKKKKKEKNNKKDSEWTDQECKVQNSFLQLSRKRHFTFTVSLSIMHNALPKRTASKRPGKKRRRKNGSLKRFLFSQQEH